MDPTDDKKTDLGDTPAVGAATDSTVGTTADVATPVSTTESPVVPTPQPAVPVAPAEGAVTADTAAPVEPLATPGVAVTPDPTTSPVATPVTTGDDTDTTGDDTDTTGETGAGGLGTT